MMTITKKKTQGFTLIELMVVIAILSILLAIIVPVSVKLRKLSENATCATRIRTIATAMTTYYADHNEFPNSQAWVSKAFGRNHSGVWAEWAYQGNIQGTPQNPATLWEYVGSEKSYICPTFERTYKSNPAFSSVPAYISYSMNEYFNPPGRDANGNFTRGSWQHSGLNLFHGQRGEVRYGNKLALVGEENTWKTPYSNHALNNLALGVGPLNGGVIDGIASFHEPTDHTMQTGFSNVAFFDLHVAKHPNKDSKDLFTPYVLKEYYNWTAP